MTFLRLNDYTWWLWFIIACCLIAGLLIAPIGLLVALCIATIQAFLFIIKERSISSFPAQLRVAYVVILMVCSIPFLHFLFWIPTIGTFALCFFGYCLLARGLSLMPWNRTARPTLREAFDTFLVPPDLSATDKARQASGCPGGVCTLDVQLARLKRK